MNSYLLNALLAMAAPSGQGGQSPMPVWAQFVPMILVFVIFYLVLIRPQQRKAKEHEVLLKTIKPGDKVVVGGGIIGVVVAVKDKTVSLRSADAKIEVLKSAVSDITERAGNVSES
jgi:preprotein translocase subunit YajC